MKKILSNQTFIIFIASLAILLGIFLRFYNIDKKIYWRDEIFTTMYVSGHTEQEVIEDVYNGNIVSASVLNKYIKPDPPKNLFTILRNLTLKPERTPLYYLSAKLWTDAIGFSMRNIRLLTAVLSLLIFPCVYWLCRELFELKLAGFIAMVLVAISPLHLIFAQEAREYSLWSVVTLLSSAAFLRAKRINTKSGWMLYAATVAFGLYTHWLFFLVVIAHGLYLVILEGVHWNKTNRRYLISTLSGVFVFIPWIIIFITNFSKVIAVPSWRNLNLSMDIMLKKWTFVLTRGFLDIIWDREIVGFTVSAPLANSISFIFKGIVAVTLVWAFYFLVRKAPKRISAFILTMIGMNVLFFIVPDLMFGGIRSTIPRYFVPCHLMIQLAVTYFFTEHLTRASISAWQRRICMSIMLIILFVSVVSCTLYSRAEVWWSKHDDIQNLPIARIVNDSPRPLLISNDEATSIVCLGRLFEPKVHLQLVTGDRVSSIPDGYSNIFLFRPSKEMVSVFRSDPKLDLEHIGWVGSFWRLKKK